MASLASQVARCIRRFNHDNMLVLADMLDERELHESASVIRNNLDKSDPFRAFITLYQIRKAIRKSRPMGDAMIRFARWEGTYKPANSRINPYFGGYRLLCQATG